MRPSVRSKTSRHVLVIVLQQELDVGLRPRPVAGDGVLPVQPVLEPALAVDEGREPLREECERLADAFVVRVGHQTSRRPLRSAPGLPRAARSPATRRRARCSRALPRPSPSARRSCRGGKQARAQFRRAPPTRRSTSAAALSPPSSSRLTRCWVTSQTVSRESVAGSQLADPARRAAAAGPCRQARSGHPRARIPSTDVSLARARTSASP